MEGLWEEIRKNIQAFSWKIEEVLEEVKNMEKCLANAEYYRYEAQAYAEAKAACMEIYVDESRYNNIIVEGQSSPLCLIEVAKKNDLGIPINTIEVEWNGKKYVFDVAYDPEEDVGIAVSSPVIILLKNRAPVTPFIGVASSANTGGILYCRGKEIILDLALPGTYWWSREEIRRELDEILSKLYETRGVEVYT